MEYNQTTKADDLCDFVIFPVSYLHLLARPQRVVLLLLHHLHLHSALQHVHAGVAQVRADKVLQVETFNKATQKQSARWLEAQTFCLVLFLCTTWEIGDEDDLGLVVQRALDLLELGPPGREVHQQGHQPRVWLER